MIINSAIKWLIIILMFPIVLYASYSSEWNKGNTGVVSYKEFKQIIVTLLFSALYLLIAFLLLQSFMFVLKQGDLLKESVDIKMLVVQFGAYFVVGMLTLFMDLRRAREYEPKRFALYVFVLWLITAILFHIGQLDFIGPMRSATKVMQELRDT